MKRGVEFRVLEAFDARASLGVDKGFPHLLSCSAFFCCSAAI